MWRFVFLLFILPAAAEEIASFDFSTTGSLDGQGGGSGWAGDWVADPLLCEVIEAPEDFVYDVPGGGTVNR